MVRRVLVGFAAAAALLLAACGSGPSSVDDAAGTRLQFTAKTLDGKPFSGASLNGRPAVLWFWAPHCPVCQGEAAQVARVAAAHPTVTFVGVGGGEQLPALQGFAARYGIDRFTELADSDSAVSAKFGVADPPAYAFVTPDGAVDVVHASLSESGLTERVRALTGR